MRRDYELGFILNPEVNEEQTRAILRRDPKTVQKEREARAAAAAAAAAPTTAPAAPEAEAGAEDEMAVPTGDVPAGQEGEIPTGLSAEEIEDVPPAIEDEESVEA